MSPAATRVTVTGEGEGVGVGVGVAPGVAVAPRTVDAGVAVGVGVPCDPLPQAQAVAMTKPRAASLTARPVRRCEWLAAIESSCGPRQARRTVVGVLRSGRGRIIARRPT
jgi:hypothetical protein